MTAGPAGIATEPFFPGTPAIVHSASAHGRDRWDILVNLGTPMTSALDFRDLLRAIATTLRGVSPCHEVWIALPDPTTRELRVYGIDTLGTTGDPAEGAAVPRSAPEAVFRSGEPLVAGRVRVLALPQSAGGLGGFSPPHGGKRVVRPALQGISSAAPVDTAITVVDMRI